MFLNAPNLKTYKYNPCHLHNLFHLTSKFCAHTTYIF
nr:MAG TPA: hypothetical protein [Caudoviricetes sp.]